MEPTRRDLLEGIGSFLYDIIGTNTYGIETHLDNIEADGEDVPTKSQLDVVRGPAMPPFDANLSASQWRINNIGMSTNTLKNLCSPILGHGFLRLPVMSAVHPSEMRELPCQQHLSILEES